MIRIEVCDEELRRVVHAQGLPSFEAMAERAKEMGIRLGVMTIYNFSKNANWTRETLESVCTVLDCEPSQILEVKMEEK